MNTPKVSIVIPSYNRETLISQTLDSVMAQSYRNWECLIIDDQSSDKSAEVVIRYCEEDSRFRFHIRNREPKGAPTCRNIGIEKAHGKFILFLDSDDVLAPYCLEERLSYFERSLKLDFLVFNGSFFMNTVGDSDVLWNKYTEESDLNRFLRGDTVWSMTGPIWKRESIIASHLKFNEKAQSSQDWEFHVKAMLKGLSYLKIDKSPDYFVRRDPGYSENSISGKHHSFDRLMNRLGMIMDVFEEYQISPAQSNLLLFNLKSQIFHIYRRLTFQQLKTIFNRLKSFKIFKRKDTFGIKVYFFLILFLLKLTRGKSHHLVYKVRKARNKNKSFRKYRYQNNTNK